MNKLIDTTSAVTYNYPYGINCTFKTQEQVLNEKFDDVIKKLDKIIDLLEEISSNIVKR